MFPRNRPLAVAAAFASLVLVAAPAQAGMCQDMPRQTGAGASHDEHVKGMQAAHERMRTATTPEERRKAMDDARKAMREGMPASSGTSHQGGTMHGAGADERMCMMEDRLGMMQMMMDMMLDAPMMGTEGMRRGGPPPK
jgi:hypothetical protein